MPCWAIGVSTPARIKAPNTLRTSAACGPVVIAVRKAGLDKAAVTRVEDLVRDVVYPANSRLATHLESIRPGATDANMSTPVSGPLICVFSNNVSLLRVFISD